MPNANSYQSGAVLAAATSVVSSLYGISLARRPPFALLLQGVRALALAALLVVVHESRHENVLVTLPCVVQAENTEGDSKCSTSWGEGRNERNGTCWLTEQTADLRLSCLIGMKL